MTVKWTATVFLGIAMIETVFNPRQNVLIRQNTRDKGHLRCYQTNFISLISLPSGNDGSHPDESRDNVNMLSIRSLCMVLNSDYSI